MKVKKIKKGRKSDPKKFKMAPFALLIAFVVFGLLIDSMFEIGMLGIGFWLGFLASIVIAFEEKIMELIGQKKA